MPNWTRARDQGRTNRHATFRTSTGSPVFLMWVLSVEEACAAVQEHHGQKGFAVFTFDQDLRAEDLDQLAAAGLLPYFVEADAEGKEPSINHVLGQLKHSLKPLEYPAAPESSPTYEDLLQSERCLPPSDEEEADLLDILNDVHTSEIDM